MLQDFKGFLNENKDSAEELEFLHQVGMLSDTEYYKRRYDLAPLDIDQLAKQVQTDSLDFDLIPQVWVSEHSGWVIWLADGPRHQIAGDWTTDDEGGYDWLRAIETFFEESVKIGGPYGIVWNEEDDWLAVRDPKSKYGVRLITRDGRSIEKQWFESFR